MISDEISELKPIKSKNLFNLNKIISEATDKVTVKVGESAESIKSPTPLKFKIFN